MAVKNRDFASDVELSKRLRQPSKRSGEELKTTEPTKAKPDEDGRKPTVN